MAKERVKIQKFEVKVLRDFFKPKDKDGNPIVNKQGEEIEKPYYRVRMALMGKVRDFKFTTKSKEDFDMLEEFFALKSQDGKVEINYLDATVETSEFQDSVTKRNKVVNALLVHLDKKDNIHVIRLYPDPAEANLFNMAIREIAEKWETPSYITETRQARKEAAEAARAQKLQEQKEAEDNPKKDSKKGSKKGDDIPF